MASAAEPSPVDHDRRRTLHTDSLSLLDLRLLSQSDLNSLAFSASSASAPNRCQDDDVIPKIDRSVFNESAGSRKQTYSRLRLAPRGKKPPAAAPARASASASHIPLDEENTKIIALLQNLFGVESLRTATAAPGGGNDNTLVSVQVDFKQAESGTPDFPNVPIDVVDEGSTRKRKRGRSRRDESSGTPVIGEEEAPQQQPPKKAEVEGLVEEVRDPFVEEVKRRTLGMETEAQIFEFVEGLKGEWASQRKKRRIVEATDLGPFLPSGWKAVLTLQKRAGRAAVVCGRYVSPYGHQFVSFKEVSAYLVSFYGEDMNRANTSYTDGSLQCPSNINVTSGSVVGRVPTGEMNTDVSASLHLASTSVHTHHEKQATVSSSMGREKLHTWGGKLGDTTCRAFDRQTEDRQPMMDDNANSVWGCSLQEDRVHNQRMVDSIAASDAANNLYIPLAFSSSFPNNNSGIYQLPDEINAVTCMKSSISNFAGENRNIGHHETAPCGNEQAHEDNNGHGLSFRLVEDHRQKVGFRSSTLSPNSEGEKFACSNLEDRHLIRSPVDMEISDRKPTKDEKQDNISDRTPLLEFCKINDLPTDEGAFFPSGYNHNDSLSTCARDASQCGGVDIASNLSVAKDVSDNHAPPSQGFVTNCAEEKNSSNGQNCEMDNLLKASSKSNVLTPTGGEDPSVFYDNVNDISVGTFDALQAVDAGYKKPQLAIDSCSNDVAVRSQGCESVALGGSVLNRFDKQSMDGVSNANKSCLSENAKSEQVDILRTNSTGMPGFR